MKFQTSNKPEGTIVETSKGYYTLHLGERTIGGTNVEALKRFARREGWIVRSVQRWKPAFQSGAFELF